MKLPRNLGGLELVNLLQRYGYRIVRQEGSHLRLESHYKNEPHHLTIPAHHQLKIGTLNQILRMVSGFVGMSKDKLVQELFG